ncbi:MAG: hypothetical protein HOV81_11605, partial [Kofleriaceae bacterium]|nr:hypothetical protein [Kofleriaceae bacterium]
MIGSSWGIADGGTLDGNAAVVIDPTHVVLAQNNSVAFWNGTNWTVRVVPG